MRERAEREGGGEGGLEDGKVISGSKGNEKMLDLLLADTARHVESRSKTKECEKVMKNM